MLPQYKRMTEYTTPSGNTQIFVYRRNAKKKQTLLQLSEKKKQMLEQKILGLLLVVIGIIGCLIFPEDCGGCLFACVMGILRVVF